MLDKMLIEHCSPTLGGLKTAGLFSYPYSSGGELDFAVSAWNSELNSKGVSLYILCRRKERALVYVCRDSMLEDDLQNTGVQEFLKGYGYRGFGSSCCIENLQERLRSSSDFPHEIGLFLGYPLEDVKGFIENAGQNCKCTGYWKVYCNECETVKLFMKYKKCKDIYTKLFENRGRSVWELTVAVS